MELAAPLEGAGQNIIIDIHTPDTFSTAEPRSVF